uniref:Uncharacterized protein n=1 Tax=Oryza barthii TaxID=65489 RepID=A0A679BBJ4_9ORYZ|nr:hypothetical protein [Oryza barthii]
MTGTGCRIAHCVMTPEGPLKASDYLRKLSGLLIGSGLLGANHLLRSYMLLEHKTTAPISVDHHAAGLLQEDTHACHCTDHHHHHHMPACATSTHPHSNYPSPYRAAHHPTSVPHATAPPTKAPAPGPSPASSPPIEASTIDLSLIVAKRPTTIPNKPNAPAPTPAKKNPLPK